MSIFLTGLATAVPPHVLPQSLVLENARRILGPKYAQFERLASTFHTAGVDKRHSVAPFSWFETEKTWAERNACYIEGAVALFMAAARGALTSAGWSAEDVDGVVSVSSTGIATPSLEALAWKEMGFRQDVQRLPVFGLGCAGGVTGLSVARDLAAARPGTRVLMVAVEACTLSFRSDRLQKADIIATVLFGDGAAAACISSEQGAGTMPSITMGVGQQHLWPDTLGIMGWEVDANALGVVFDRSIPSFTLQNLAEAVHNALERAKISPSEVARFVCHPGGAKVVSAIEEALDLEKGTLAAERDVLRDFGNMSAPTVLFVLDRVIAAGAKGQMVLSALGPGFTASLLPLRIS